MAKQQVEIDYTDGGNAYKTVLTATSLDIFVEAAKNPSFLTLEGEALVAAFDAAYAGKGLLSIERYKDRQKNDGPQSQPALLEYDVNGDTQRIERRVDGKLHDPPDGSPAVQIFANGLLKIRSHYQHNKLHDSITGEAAQKEYSPSRKPRYEGHYNHGFLNDAPDGAPALQTFHDNGTPATTERFKNGRRNDGPNEEPAQTLFNNDGDIVAVEHYLNGRLQDPPSGNKPAVREYSYGDITQERHYNNGELHDGINGQPAMLKFAGKKLIQATRYSNGVQTTTLSQKQLADYDGRPQLDEKIAFIKQSFGNKLKVKGP